MEKAFVFPRIMAYILDIIIISLIVSLLSNVLPNNNKVIKLREDYAALQEDFLASKITEDEYMTKSEEVVYELDYQSVPSSIVSVAFVIGYFVVFQFYNNGQTIGKKIMKIKIVSVNDKPLSINNYIYRTFILNGLLINILNLILLVFISKNNYFYFSFTLQMVQSVLILVTIFMSLFKKDGRGLHDKIANTKVVMGE